VAAKEQLAQFQNAWHLHHPLERSQLEYAGKESKVVSISFYHGGDELYTLEGIPGIWHECCIRACLEVD